jgi:hypothetical protein
MWHWPARIGSHRPAASMHFESYSNASNGDKWALLMVTNRDTCDLLFTGPYTIEFTPSHTNDDALSDQARWQVPSLVAPGSAGVVAVKIPPEQRRWRASCFLVRHPLQDKLKAGLPGRISWAVRDSRGWQMDSFNTDWISQ